MSIARNLFNLLSAPLVAFLRQPARPSVAIVEKSVAVHTQAMHGQSKRIAYECPSLVTLWRAESLYDKEPDTIQWLDGMAPGEVLYDVGANVGMYTIYAGMRGMDVYAFEPEAQNFALLNRNIRRNQLQNTVSAYALAIGASETLNYLYLSSEDVGGANNTFGKEVDFNHAKMTSKFRQGAFSLSLDDLWQRFGLPIPHHIKIDVDGLEAEILQAAERTLQLPSLKSILVELNEQIPVDAEVLSKMDRLGFRCLSRFHSPVFDHTPYRHIYNYIFTRNEQAG